MRYILYTYEKEEEDDDDYEKIKTKPLHTLRFTEYGLIPSLKTSKNKRKKTHIKHQEEKKKET